MDYFKYRFTTERAYTDILIAFLADLPFDTFEESAIGFDAYMPALQSNETIDASIADLSVPFDFSFEKEFIKGENWNALWETNFHPVEVEDFCRIRADFHPSKPGFQYELQIQPKMAFGTGHHETTWLVMQQMRDIAFTGKKVLDYGCGTGILAILAMKLGAGEAEAVDIEPQSYENTLENCAINDVTGVTARCGDIHAIEGSNFDVILANINRNVILHSYPALSSLARAGGLMLASGFLLQDIDILVQEGEANGFSLKKQTNRGNWVCLIFQKN